jgi:hypothetical protein
VKGQVILVAFSWTCLILACFERRENRQGMASFALHTQCKVTEHRGHSVLAMLFVPFWALFRFYLLFARNGSGGVVAHIFCAVHYVGKGEDWKAVMIYLRSLTKMDIDGCSGHIVHMKVF